MYRYSYMPIAIVLLLLLINSCAGVGGRTTHTYRSNIGTAWFDDVGMKVPPLLENRLGYEIFNRSEDTKLLAYQTDWNSRRPFDDERALGAIDARTRLRIEIRARGQASLIDQTARRGSVTLVVENSIKIDENEWIAVEPTASMQQYIDEIERELRRELNPT
jgi:hypothetical protein